MKISVRQYLPPTWVNVFLGTCFVLSSLIGVWLKSVGEETVVFAPVLVLCIFAAFYAFIRVKRSHPCLDQHYCIWLSLTPWRHGMPLPLGEVRLIWLDAVVIGILSVLACTTSPSYFWIPPLVFALVYLAMLTLAFCTFEQFAFPVLVLFIAPLGVYPFGPWQTLPVLVILYLLACKYLNKLMHGFPGNAPFFKSDPIDGLRRQAVTQRIIGWPFDKLKLLPDVGVKTSDAFGLALLFTWWAHVAFSFADRPKVVLVFPLFLTFLGVAFFRFMVYASTYLPPISLWGRIATGRLVIPRFDIIFLGPLCTILAGVVILLICERFGLPWRVGAEMSLFTAFFLTFAMPPTVKRWRLTGAHRIVPSLQRRQVQPTARPDPVTRAIKEALSQRNT